jgi:hypothetical protein
VEVENNGTLGYNRIVGPDIVNISDGSIVARISGYGDYRDPDW